MAFNYALRPSTIQKITMASSAASLASSAFGSQTEYVRICAATDFHVIFGTAPTAANRVEEDGAIECITNGGSSNASKMEITFVIRR